MIIIDSSVAFKWFATHEVHTDQALLLLREHASREIELAAPFPLYAELLATLRRLRFPADIIRHYVTSLFEVSLTVIPPSVELLAKAAEIAEQVNLQKRETYDAIFVAAAAIYDAPFVTADQELAKWASKIPHMTIYTLSEIESDKAPLAEERKP